MGPIRKAVFPVAGLGTRFLPATKAIAKEMLPVVDKPLVQYGVEEAVEAGIRDIVFVTGRSKRSIEDHFDKVPELERELEEAGKHELLELTRAVLPDGVSVVYTRQPEPLGLGHAVLCARPAVGDEPFAVILPDDLIHHDGPGALAQMVRAWKDGGGSIVAVEEVAREHTARYGIVSVEDAGPALTRVTGIIEKPPPAEAPSNLGVVGRYILTPDIFDILETTPRGSGGEIQLTDAIAEQVRGGTVRAFRFQGTRYDCGSKLGFLQATVELAVEHPEVGAEFRAYLGAR